MVLDPGGLLGTLYETLGPEFKSLCRGLGHNLIIAEAQSSRDGWDYVTLELRTTGITLWTGTFGRPGLIELGHTEIQRLLDTRRKRQVDLWKLEITEPSDILELGFCISGTHESKSTAGHVGKILRRFI